MKHKKLFCLVVFVLLIPASRVLTCGQQSWKGIVPLVTTKEQIEKTLGHPNAGGFYEFDDKRVFIKYVETQCEEIKRCDCLVPRGTVQFVDIEIYYDLYLKDLKLNKKVFTKTRNSHLPDVYTYSNHKSGLVYEVQDGKVTHIYYYESTNTCHRIERHKK